MYAEARYYSAELGRFCSADPLFVGEPEECVGSPLECGLYGYALNNPLKFVDPTGLAGLGVTAGGSFTFFIWRPEITPVSAHAVYDHSKGWSGLLDSKNWTVGSSFSKGQNENASARQEGKVSGLMKEMPKTMGMEAEAGVNISFTNATKYSQLPGKSQGTRVGGGIGLLGADAEINFMVKDNGEDPVANSNQEAVYQLYIGIPGLGVNLGASYSGETETETIEYGSHDFGQQAAEGPKIE